MKTVFLITIGIYLLLNLLVTFGMTLKSMYEDFWKSQKVIGKICANIVFATAWILKGCIYGLIIVVYWMLYGIERVIVALYRIAKVLYSRINSCNL